MQIFAVIIVIALGLIANRVGQNAHHSVNLYRSLRAELAGWADAPAHQKRMFWMLLFSLSIFSIGGIFLALSLFGKMLQFLAGAFRSEPFVVGFALSLLIGLGFFSGIVRYRIKLGRQIAQMNPKKRKEAFGLGPALLALSPESHADPEAIEDPTWFFYVFLSIFMIAGLGMLYFSFVI